MSATLSRGWGGVTGPALSRQLGDAIVSPRAPAGQPQTDQLRDIRSIMDAALSALESQSLLEALVVRVKEALRADTAAILLLDRPSGLLIATAASGLEEEVRQGVRVPVGKGFAGRVAAQRHPVILREVDAANVVNPLLLARGIKSLMGPRCESAARSSGCCT
ncbi:MAG: hypothetical protein M3Y33_17745 [Actinomycetota bacterium]|nr:hypothetical protein [Actinomycetota bacterium]